MILKRQTKAFPVGAELFNADRQTYVTALIVTFGDFVKAREYLIQNAKNPPLKKFNIVVRICKISINFPPARS
jgi:hypothetical protein